MAMPRRDGYQQSFVIADYCRFQVPAHVGASGTLIEPDSALLDALLESRERLDPRTWAALYQGIVHFNQANTDQPDMSPDMELVMTYSAIEQVLGITSRKDQRNCSKKFAQVWHPSREVPRDEWRTHPTKRFWKENALRVCWAEDLKTCRGNLAHGHREKGLQSHWTVRQHLLLTSFVIPQLVKQLLSEKGAYTLKDDDKGNINALESLLNLPDVLARDDEQHDTWRSVLRREHRRQNLLSTYSNMEYDQE